MTITRRTLVFPAVLLLAGCGDRLSQGGRVVLVNPGSDKVQVTGMVVHDSTEPRAVELRRAGLSRETSTTEILPAGTRATVILDDPKELGDERLVKITLLEPPFAGQIGKVMRKYLRPE